jgi:hypothetical protein
MGFLVWSSGRESQGVVEILEEVFFRELVVNLGEALAQRNRGGVVC